MTHEWEREPRLVDNFSKVPHGLWTADLTYGAKCLLGWLHSHSSAYLAQLTSRRIRAEFGCSTVIANWIEELSAAGFIEVIQDGNRQRFKLKAARWDALATRTGEPKRSKNDHLETVENRPLNGRKTSDKRSKNDHIEEQGEEQGEDQKKHSLAQSSNSPTNTVATVSETETFDAFWSRYPRKVGKGAAQSRWRKLSPVERSAVMVALPEHVARWREMRTETQFIPHPATWLSQQRWEDQLATDARREMSMPSAVRHAADLLARLENSAPSGSPTLSYGELEQAYEAEAWE